MKIHELIDALKKAQKDIKQFQLIYDAMMVLDADFRFFNVAHDKFLPAAKDYRRYIKGVHGGDRQSSEFKSIRGRLGAYSRVHYKAQKETFTKLVNLVVSCLPTKVSNDVIEQLWRMFKIAQVKWMAYGRAH